MTKQVFPYVILMNTLLYVECLCMRDHEIFMHLLESIKIKMKTTIFGIPVQSIKMTNQFIIVFGLIVLVSITSVLGQCTFCAPRQGCCMGHMHGQWYCCGAQTLLLNDQEKTPWNFNVQIKYDVYVWDCSPATIDPAQKYTNISCVLDGRWSLSNLTFQLQAIPSSELKTITGEYTMKNSPPQKIAFQADDRWALTVPVDRNDQIPGIYDKIQFNYGGFNYTYHFGYGPYPHCPRC